MPRLAPERRRDLAALAAGAAMPAAFAPLGWAPLAPLALAVLFHLWRRPGAAAAARRGFLFGLGQFGVGVSWVFNSLHDFGNMALPLAVLAVALFVAYLSLYPALAGALQARLAPRGRAPWLAAPALWTLAEWLRGRLLTGFPWLEAGYSQAGWPLDGLAPWLGVHGVTFGVALVAALLAAAAGARRRWAWLAAAAVVVAAAWGAGLKAWSRPAGDPLPVALVQGNVPLAEKWDPRRRGAILRRYLELTRSLPGARLVIWPEAAIPGFWDAVPTDYRRALEAWAAAREGAVLVGVLERRLEGGRLAYYNTVQVVGARPAAYRKHHLVPFGEYPPLPPLTRWFMERFDIPMSDFTAASPPAGPVEAAGLSLGITICYEDAFPRDLRPLLPEAGVLVNVSEDAWFGNSLGPWQRLQMARMRARESERPVLRVANTGVSAVIGPRGELEAYTPQFAVRTLAARVQPRAGATPYVRWGDGPLLLWLGGMLVWAAWRRRGRQVRPPGVSAGAGG